MTLNLGDVTFGLDADTTGLQKSIDKLQRFGSEVDKVARSQQKGAQSAVVALSKQERAIKSALQQTLNLRLALRKAGAPPQQLARTTQAFRKLTNTMTRGKLSILEFTRAQDRFRAATGKTQRSLRALGSNAQGSNKKVAKFANVMRNLESSAVLAVGPLSGVGARVRSLGAIAGRSNIQMIAMFAGITALVVVLGKLSSAAVRAAREMQTIQTRLEFATGSAIAAAREFAFITKTAKTLGLNLASTAKQFALFAASAKDTSLEGEKTREIFTGISAASRALNLSADDTAGIFKAITQIMSKGTVQAEELRGQMGERIPGAFRLAAKAMGVTTAELNKLLKDGKVLSDDFLPKLAKVFIETFGDASLIAAQRLDASLERLTTSTFLFNVAFDKTTGLSKKFQKAVEDLTSTIDFLTDNLDKLPLLLGAVAGSFAVLVGPKIITGLALIATKTFAIAAGVAAINFSLLIGPLIVLAGALGGAGAAFLLFRETILEAGMEADAFVVQNRKVIAAMEELDTVTKASVDALIASTNEKILARRIDLQSAQDTLKETAKLLALQQILPKPFGTLFGKGVALLGKDFEAVAQSVAVADKRVKELLDDLGRIKDLQAGLKLEETILSPEATKAIEKATKAIARTVLEAERLNSKILAVAEGGKRLKILEEAFAQEDKINKMVEALEKVEVAQEKINQLTREFRESLQTYDDAAAKFKILQDRLKAIDKIGESAMKSIEDGILNVIDGTKTMGQVFASVIEDMLRNLTRFFFQAAIARDGGGNFITDILRATLPAFAGGGTNITAAGASSAGSTVLTARSHGGPVSPGRTFKVGERGPELFRPTSVGRIMPNMGAGGNVNITVVNNSTGTETKIREATKNNTRDIEITIDDLIAAKINNPASRTSRALRTTLSQGVIRR